MSIEKHRQLYNESWQNLDFWIQGSILEFVVSLQELLDVKDMRRKDLAAALGVSEATISKALRTDGNLTIKMMNKLAGAVDAAVHVHVDHRRFNGRWVRTNEPERPGAAATLLKKSRLAAQEQSNVVVFSSPSAVDDKQGSLVRLEQ